MVPSDIFGDIFQYLNADFLYMDVRYVCRYWNRIIEHRVNTLPHRIPKGNLSIQREQDVEIVVFQRRVLKSGRKRTTRENQLFKFEVSPYNRPTQYHRIFESVHMSVYPDSYNQLKQIVKYWNAPILTQKIYLDFKSTAMAYHSNRCEDFAKYLNPFEIENRLLARMIQAKRVYLEELDYYTASFLAEHPMCLTNLPSESISFTFFKKKSWRRPKKMIFWTKFDNIDKFMEEFKSVIFIEFQCHF